MTCRPLHPQGENGKNLNNSKFLLIVSTVSTPLRTFNSSEKRVALSSLLLAQLLIYRLVRAHTTEARGF